MYIEVIITGIVGLITTVSSAFVSWLFAKKKYNAEVDNDLIENMQKSLDFYMKLSDDNKLRLEEALRRNTALEQEVSELRSQVSQIMSSICYKLECSARQRLLEKPEKSKASKKSVADEASKS